MLAHICFHDGLGSHFAVAMREERRAQNPGSSELPHIGDRLAHATEALLRRLAAVCDTAQTSEAAGTQHGGTETVRWLLEELETSARQWHAAAVGGAASSAEMEQTSGTLAAALEVPQVAHNSCMALA